MMSRCLSTSKRLVMLSPLMSYGNSWMRNEYIISLPISEYHDDDDEEEEDQEEEVVVEVEDDDDDDCHFRVVNRARLSSARSCHGGLCFYASELGFVCRLTFSLVYSNDTNCTTFDSRLK